MDQIKHAWLNRYIIKKRRIDGLYKRLRDLKEESSIRAVQMTGLPGAKRDTSLTEEKAIKSVELEKRIQSLEKKARVCRAEILEAIDSLDNPTKADILEKHFILDQSLSSIANDMKYTEHHTIRLYSTAVSEIDLSQWEGGGERV
jgi:hypothetical protein